MKAQALAMVFTETEAPFVVEHIDFPQLKEGELLIKNSYSTICTSDLHTFYGRRHSCSHSVLGHEIIGTVEEIGSDPILDYHQNPLQIGDRITWSVYAHDPNSVTAQKGYPQKSEGLYKYGHEQMTEEYKLNGGFATHCHLRKGTSIFKLPETLNDREAAPLNCTHATIAGALRLAGNLKGKNILINGTGMLGLSACAMARENGAEQVWAQDISQPKAEQSLLFGADRFFIFEQDDIETASRESGGIDIIIETSGSPAAVEKCTDLLNIGGTLVLVGSVFPQRNISINAERLVRGLISIKGLHNYKPKDLDQAVSFLTKAKTRYPFAELVGKEYDLFALDAAFETGNQGQYFRVGIRP
ncbi:zinc-binding dehydrogenase [Marinilongibacter aquaticus]|uniref:zinc-binding dehydrogenase n=1 Tax=Marinilongibacter aquaticus TaxID=2975157 RepID=UPI0021BD4925|nr:zinc-binding dehydrogenase [Marinilongibacter aquaticus]UBM59051.1 zinc-binding dehydrogenase [Marinilongibacter aquaticus]